MFVRGVGTLPHTPWKFGGGSHEWTFPRFSERGRDDPYHVQIQQQAATGTKRENGIGSDRIARIARRHPSPIPPTGLDPQRIDASQKEILNLGHSAIQPFYHPVMEP